MSIIYGTLQRLEAENPAPGADSARACPSRPAPETRGFSVKLWVAAIAVVIAGASVMLWPRDDRSAALLDPVPPDAYSRTPAVEMSRQQPLQASAAKPAETPLDSTLPDSGSAVQDATLPVATTPTDVAVAAVEPVAVEPVAVEQVAVERHAPASEDVAGPAVIEESAPDARTRPEAAGAAAAATGTAEAGPDAGGASSPQNRVQAVAVDEVIEQARLALSGGHYQQALSTLEQLGSVPENRADFWLIKGSAHLGMGQLDPAGTAFASAQVLAPHNAQIAIQLAILKQEQGDHVGALQILDRAATRHPDVPEICLNQGYSQLALGTVQEAKRSFRAFLQMTAGRSLYSQQRAAVKEWLAQVSAVPD